MRGLILSLVRSAGILSTADLVHELTVLRRTGCAAELPPITERAVLDCLNDLYHEGKVGSATGEQWHAVYQSAPQQALLF